MKITIYNTQNTVDPGALYSDEEFEKVLSQLEKYSENALRAVYPEAEIVFLHEDNTYADCVTDNDLDWSEIEEIDSNVGRILEEVFELGDFWL